MSTSTEPANADEKQPIQMDVKVESPQACLREVIVTIPKAEVDRYFKDAFDELVPEASVPGFRSGRAPRKLVEKQFRDRVAEQVKGSLLMDSLSQVTDSQDFSAISEPKFDYESIQEPGDSEFKYQFTIEVRPQFETPDWKGIKLEKPVEDVTDEDVDDSLERVLSRHATLEATDEPAETGDKLLITAVFRDGDRVLSEMDEERVTLTERLSFSDGTIDDFGSLMEGVKEGETRSGKVTISEGASSELYQGKQVDASIHVVEVLKKETPKITESLLEELGDFESEEELRTFVRESLVRQAEYRTQQALRSNVVEALAGSADFELPPDLVRRQTSRELERKILELQRSGFDSDAVRRYVNASRQNQQASTESALREHFILEQIAEETEVDAEPSDYDREIAYIAEQSQMPERRVRARLEKSGQMDALRNQIIERKVIDMIVDQAKVTEKPAEKEKKGGEEEFAVYHNVVPNKDPSAIPEAQHDDKTPAGAESEKD